MIRPPPTPTLFPYTTLFRSARVEAWHRTLDRSLPTRVVPRFAKRWDATVADIGRSEEHTSELQSRRDLVCRLLLEKKKRISRQKCAPKYGSCESRRRGRAAT